MRSIVALFAMLCGLTVSSCSTTTPDTTTIHETTSQLPDNVHSKSTIVSQMDNYYEENPDLAIDPCHDSFIQDMTTLGYTLSADVILPEGRKTLDYWTASCQYKSGKFSALVDSSTAPALAPNESLEPKTESKGWSRLIDIGGRNSIVRPSADGSGGCMVTMTTTFGSMTTIGGDRQNPDPDADCDRIIELLRQIEPWIND